MPAAAAAQQRIDGAVRASDPATLRAVVHDLRDCIAVYASLCDRMDLLCDALAVPSGNIRHVLTDALEIATEFAGPVLLDASPAAAPEPAPADAIPAAPNTAPDVILDREDALRQLSRIAAFFQRTEPNAPTGFVLETLARRARLPLADLLRELVPDESTRQALLQSAGIGPDATPGSVSG